MDYKAEIDGSSHDGSQMSQGPAPKSFGLAEEDVLRADVYRLLARFLAHPPSQEDLKIVADTNGDETAFGKAANIFAKLCRQYDTETVRQEYHELFIGVGRGELVPYASYYLTGFLNEKPLAKLRNDMTDLGIEKAGENKDPEDHIATLFEIMAGLILGDYGKPADLAAQKQFYENHIERWINHFLADLKAA
ncbi:MAG: TorD/DmsD family molecular chaperone, partial [Rhizobiaceae bacterium]